MRMPSLSLAVGLLLARGYFTVSRLNSNAKSRVLIPQFQPQLLALDSANDAKRKADNAVLMARGPVVEVDAAAGDFLTTFQLDVLKVVGKNFDDPLYKAIFPKGLSDLRRLHGQALCDELVRIGTRLGELGKSHALAAHAPTCTSLVKSYADPLKALKTAVDAQAATDIVVAKARAEWRTAYDAIAGALRQLFPGRRNYQESFFLPETTTRAKKTCT